MDDADPRRCHPAPSIAIESSPGRYVGLWFTNKPTTEALNRRLAYHIGADKSGWDLTQVLRIPGTTNYKYDSRPKTRFIATDDKTWDVDELDHILPKEVEHAGIPTDASNVWRRVKKTIKNESARAFLQRELTTRRIPAVGKRSEVLFRLVATMLEAGIKEEDGLTLIKCSVWNKFAGRRNEDAQLRREWEKAENQHFRGNSVVAESEDDEERLPAIGMVPMSDVEEVDFDWVWYRRLARGMTTILEGDPEAGKSYVAQMIAARITQGMPLPCEDKTVPVVKGPVLYFDLENKRDTVTIKRLRWNGFDPTMMKNYFQDDTFFSLDSEDDMERVYEACERIKPVLVVFDTMNTYIGRANTSQGAEAQQTFIRGFNGIAQRFNCAVLVLRHLTKGVRTKAIYMGQGNISLLGVARFVLIAGKHPEDPDIRLLASNKNNNTKHGRTIEYQIIDASTKNERDKSKLQFGNFVEYNSEDIVSAAPKDDKDARTEAEAFLKEVLDEGPLELSKIQRMAEARSVSQRSLYRAADALEVVKRTKGFGKDRASTWALPEA